MFSFPPLTPFVKKLLITLFSAFVLIITLERFAELPLSRLLALDPVGLGPLTPLQIFSYVLVERVSSVTPMLISLFFMWIILSPFEAAFGARSTFQLSLAGTVAAALGVILIALIAPYPGYQLYGSYPIAYAGMAAMTQVMRGGRMWFFGVVQMTSRQLLAVLFGLSVVQFIISGDYFVLVASISAMLAGGGYVRYMARPPRRSGSKRPGAARFRVLRGGGGGGGGSDDSDRPKWLN